MAARSSPARIARTNPSMRSIPARDANDCQFRKLDPGVQRDIHELFTRSAGDLLDTPRFHGPRACRCSPDRHVAQPHCRDRSRTPKGVHVASLFCQRFAYKLAGGRDWRQEKTRAEDLVFATVESYAPNFRAKILDHSSLEPARPRRKTRPSRWRYFSRRVRPRSVVGRAASVRLR